ncbi:ABC transporter substrate-binding protein [Brachybacterium sp. UMB0905]|uniref:ABC transporter substrate-binding protein n=1 Tax=Brachybacterium sp. UMB0905 TaxID=2069310 RepID=UPI000C80FB48|nr:extracellular solute-binding protein [Brachybacterium sp. UMB0905]PMC74809.1 ABC transporter substrate-binding protein [Brachybacterium sp. UMB0905]
MTTQQRHIEQELHTLDSLKHKLRLGDIDRRGFLSAAGALSGTALLAGCGGGPQGPGGVAGGTIPLYTVENDPATLAFYNMAIDNFTQEHPETKVEVTVYSDSNQAQYLSTAFQNGVDVGIFSPSVSSFRDFAAAGHLAELDDMITEIGEDDFMPATRIRVDGHDYGMPLQNNSSLVYYRKDLLEAAAIAEPTTFDDYLGAIEELHGKDGVNGIAMAVGSTAQLPLQFFAPYLYQSGNDYFDAQGQLTFDQPGVLTAVERFVAVMRNAPESLYNAAFGDIVTVYAAGQAAFATFPGRLGVNLYNDYPDIAEVSGVMRIPAGDYMTGELHFGSGQQYGLYSGTAEPELAKEFLKLLTTGDEAVEFAKTVPGHLLPALKSVRAKFEEEISSATEGYLADHGDWIQTFMDCVPQAMTASTAMGVVEDGEFQGKHTNLNPFAQKIWPTPAIDGVMFQEILIDGKEPEAAWNTACETMREVTDAFHDENPDWEPEII